MSFDAHAECPSFFEDENNLNKETSLTDPKSTSIINAKEDCLENIETRISNLSIKNGEITNTPINYHYTQPYIRNNIKGKAMFSLHRHIKADTLPCLAIDSLALETIFRMMKINFNVRYDIKKYYKPSYINHEGYLLTGIKKILHYLNLRSKMGIDNHLSSIENSVIRSFNMMLIDQTSFIIDFYRYYENYTSWKNVIQSNSKQNSFQTIKNRKKSYKLIKERMYCLGFYNWCEEGIKSVAKEDFRILSTFLDNKKYFMGEIPCVLDCITFAVIANLICSNHANPLVTIIKAEFNNLIEHFERIKLLFWPDWDEQLNKKSSRSQQPSTTTTVGNNVATARPKSFSYKRLSLRFKAKQSKSGSVRSAKASTTSTTKNNKINSVSNTATNRIPNGNETLDLTTTKEDLPSETGSNIKQEQDQQQPTTVEHKDIKQNPDKHTNTSLYKNFVSKCNFLRKSKRKKSDDKVESNQDSNNNSSPNDTTINTTQLNTCNKCACEKDDNIKTTTNNSNNNNNKKKMMMINNNVKDDDDINPSTTLGHTITTNDSGGNRTDDEQYDDAIDDITHQNTENKPLTNESSVTPS